MLAHAPLPSSTLRQSNIAPCILALFELSSLQARQLSHPDPCSLTHVDRFVCFGSTTKQRGAPPGSLPAKGSSLSVVIVQICACARTLANSCASAKQGVAPRLLLSSSERTLIS
eukprot:950989-Pleurochrysis_carterae.AAC.1